MNQRKILLCFLIIAFLGSTNAVDLTGLWSDQGGFDANVLSQIPTPDEQSYSQYSQYFSISSGSTEGPDQASGIQSYNIKGQEPSSLLVGGQQQKAISYSQMQPYAVFTGGNTLWIQGQKSWTQYAKVPLGASMSLIAVTSDVGSANLYEIYTDGQQVDTNNVYFSGYSIIPFTADTLGQHLLLFVINNQASNAVIIDVLPYYPTPVYPGPIMGGYAKVNIISDWLKGYKVYVDDIYQFTEGEGGVPDGQCSFAVSGNANHKLTIKMGGYYYSQTKYFTSGREYTMKI